MKGPTLPANVTITTTLCVKTLGKVVTRLNIVKLLIPANGIIVTSYGKTHLLALFKSSLRYVSFVIILITIPQKKNYL